LGDTFPRSCAFGEPTLDKLNIGWGYGNMAMESEKTKTAK
jgi:hypothetical protein